MVSLERTSGENPVPLLNIYGARSGPSLLCLSLLASFTTEAHAEHGA